LIYVFKCPKKKDFVYSDFKVCALCGIDHGAEETNLKDIPPQISIHIDSFKPKYSHTHKQMVSSKKQEAKLDKEAGVFTYSDKEWNDLTGNDKPTKTIRSYAGQTDRSTPVKQAATAKVG